MSCTISCLFLLMLFNSCASNQIDRKTGIEEISFGYGGGFTGEIINYKITYDSKVFENDRELKKIDSHKTLELFNNAKELNNLKFNEPSNISSFIEIKSKVKTNKIVWNINSAIDKKVITLYNNLMLTTK